MSKWARNAIACVVTCLQVSVAVSLPHPSDIIGKLACGLLTDKGAEEKWSNVFCKAGPYNPKEQECIKDVEALWEKAAAKCHKAELFSEATVLPNPVDIIGKLACGLLTNKGAEEKWSNAFCKAGPYNPKEQECVKDVEALWEKAAAKCPKAELAIEATLLPNPVDIIGKLACGVLTNKEAEEKWSNAFCKAGPYNPKEQECVKDVEALWEKAAAKCPKATVLPNPEDIIGKFACGLLTNKGAEEKWSNAFCKAGPYNPKVQECVKEVETLWGKAAAKCPKASLASEALSFVILV